MSENQQSGRPVTAYPAPPPPPNPNPNPNPNGYYSYPYAAPPPYPTTYYNNTQNPPYPNYPPRATFIRRIFAAIIIAFIITVTVFFILWIVLRPRLPHFRVDSLSLSNFNLSSSSSLVTGNWDVRFTVRNPNHKISLHYHNIEAVVFYRSHSLSETTIPPFDQGTRSVTEIRATFAALGAYVDREVVEGINSERSEGSVNFNVRILAGVRLKAGAWRARRRYLRVFCGDLAVGNANTSTSAGSLIHGPRECREGM